VISVVDASLAAKWILRETESPAALALLADERRRFAAPDFIFVEVAGACVRRANMDKAVQADAIRALDEWAKIWSGQTIAGYAVTPRRLLDAADLAVSLGTPLKDCLYLALAQELDCDLLTCDVRFRDKALGVSAQVKLLAEVIA
jgi:predicted nucleic acid-binding protein